jgi:hypothetical protein
MTPATARAYRAWQKAANPPFVAHPRATHYTTEIRKQVRIARLKARYEALLVRDKYNRVGYP